MKKTISILLLAFMLLIPNYVFANAEIDIESGNVIIEPSISVSSYFYAISNLISNMGNGTITIGATSETKNVVNTIYVIAYLQKYDSAKNMWVNPYGGVYDSQNSSDYASAYKNYSVTPGRYRVYSIHKATVNGNTETLTLLSEEKIVN